MRTRVPTWALVLVGIVAVSSSGILARVAMGPQRALVASGAGAAGALAVAWWRCAAGAAALAPLAWRERATRTGSRATARLLGASGVWLALHFALFQGSLALTTVAAATTLATASPVFVALGEWLLLGDRVSRRTATGILLAVAGAVVVGLTGARGEVADATSLLGNLMAFGSAVAVTGYLLVGRRVRAEVPTATYSAVVYGVAALALLPVVLVLRVPLVGFDLLPTLALGGVVVGPQLLGHTVFNSLLDRISATFVSVVVLAEPVLATLLAWWLLDELPAALFLVGAPLVIAGVGVAATRARRPAATPETAVPAGS